jgi:uncharacterized heparinase superfamily protein
MAATTCWAPQLDTPAEIRVVADAGPLGYREIAAHGHADALAFTLSLGGEEFLVDPGTYAYHTQPEWRAYFAAPPPTTPCASTAVDQSSRAAASCGCARRRSQCTAWMASDERDFFEGRHDGYLRLPDPCCTAGASCSTRPCSRSWSRITSR